jgi:hypothetical protein
MGCLCKVLVHGTKHIGTAASKLYFGKIYTLASVVVQRVFMKIKCEQFFFRTFEDTVSYLVYLTATELRRDF